jgi:3-phenylpropionate/trans-cinnamate dioxygenase ferredoxin subunit
MSEWQYCCKTTEVSEGKPIGKEIDGVPIGVFKVGDEWYALKDVCPHQYALLSEGYQDGDAVECPLHQACFEIATGKCLSGPSDRDAETLAIKIESDEIFVRLPPSTERITPG